VVWAVGDAADDTRSSKKLARLVASDRPDRLLYLGDVYPDGTAEDFDHRYEPRYGRLARRTAPTPGNHEWPNRADGYRPYWREKLGRPIDDYYALSVGGWQILSLNSYVNSRPGSPQQRWLKRRLKSGGNCRIAFAHVPAFSAGRYSEDLSMRPLWTTLSGRAKLVLSGHDHNLQALRERDGMRQLIIGAGGRSTYPVDEANPALEFADDEHSGALRLELRPGRARYTFIDADGRELHTGTTSCSP
jgi:hypothetical protein